MGIFDGSVAKSWGSAPASQSIDNNTAYFAGGALLILLAVILGGKR